MPEALSIVLCFTLSAKMAALLARMSPYRRSKLGVLFQPLWVLPNAVETDPPRHTFVQLDSPDDNIVGAANRWRSKWHANAEQTDL